MRISKILLPVLVLVAIGCKKDKDQQEEKTAVQLLTQKPWKLSIAGFDDNQNGALDPGENILTECQKDNVYVFNPNGTGSIDDVVLVCTPPVTTNFTWQLRNNDTKLEISFEEYTVDKLSENELVLRHAIPGLVSDFVLIYRH
jgi:hypothetical protein